jgi:hypothetical protein
MSDSEVEVDLGVDLDEGCESPTVPTRTRNRVKGNGPKKTPGSTRPDPPRRKDHPYLKVRAVMSVPPFASLKGRDLFSFSESIDALASMELDVADLVGVPPRQRQRLMKKWWQTLHRKFALDVAKLADLSPKKTMDRLATMVTLITRVKPSAISAILLEAAAPSCKGTLAPETMETVIAGYECVWEEGLAPNPDPAPAPAPAPVSNELV